jgi:putative ABC transport system permease protein
VTASRALGLSYLRHELRHRWGQALATATGLTIGVALVITVTAATAGVRAAQSRVLDQLAHAATSTAAAAAVSGAVSTASGLAADLGSWVAIAALTASFCFTALLTVASVTRRVREFGTLKALGWSAGRITAQVLAESVTLGIAGTLAGLALGCAGALLIAVLGPTVTVKVAELPLTASSPPSTPAGHGIAVQFSAPISVGILALAVALGLLAAILAGGLGAWRTARLSPAAALSRIG